MECGSGFEIFERVSDQKLNLGLVLVLGLW